MKTRLLPMLAVILISQIGSKAQPNYVPSNGLKAYWPFNNQNLANDITPASYISTLQPTSGGQPVLVNNRFGNANEAYKFDGTNWIETPFAGILGDSARAVSFWAKTPGAGGAGMYPVGWGSNGFGDRFGCSLDYPGGKVAAGGANCTQPYNNPSSTSDNAWHHYVFQFSTGYGTTLSDVKVWQDAVEIFTTTIGTYNPMQVLYTTNGFNVTFGKIIYPAAPNPYTGDLDEIGIWNRILSQCEISDLYHADILLGTMSFNPAGYSGSVNNLAQFTKTVTGNNQFSTNIVGSSYSGTGISFSSGQYHFNSPATLPPGTYTITHTYTLQGGCVRTATQTIKVVENTVGFNDPERKEWDVQLFPNPTAGFISFISTIENEDFTLAIKDISGKTVYSTSLKSGYNNLDLQNLEDAIYLIEIKTKDNKVIHKKLVVAR